MKYTNPIIKGFHPDPSICRVNDDYFLVNSSFEYFPGIPIFHSKDLVNWIQIGNCNKSTLHLPLAEANDSGGIWAPTIRYNDGTFYITATLEGYGNFIINTDNPFDEWSHPIWVPMGGIDPSLFFEHGSAYYCTNESLDDENEGISLAEINIKTGELITGKRTIWNGTGRGFLEAPHIYHIGNWYYLMAAEGGTFFNHMVTISRSTDIWGPYENCPNNPILTNAYDTTKEVQCSGHGDLFCDHNNNWWMVHLATRVARRTMSNLGRETFLTPVVWEDGWPKVLNNRKAQLECDGPIWEQQSEIVEWTADFTSSEWESEWIFLRNPEMSSYEKGNGKLLMFPSITTFGDKKSPTFAAIRQIDFNTEIHTEFKFNACEIGDEGGLAIYLASDFYYKISKTRTKKGDYLIVEKRAEDFVQTIYCEPIKDGTLNIRINADKQNYIFSYSVGEDSIQEVCQASIRFLSCEVVGKCFTGTVIGLYAVSYKNTKAVMEVSRFCCK